MGRKEETKGLKVIAIGDTHCARALVGPINDREPSDKAKLRAHGNGSEHAGGLEP